MPPTKKTTKKTAKRTTKKTTAKKSLTPAHKKALAAGRTESAAVDRYLAAVTAPKKRGRRVSATTLRTRLQAAEQRARTSLGVHRVLAHQEVRDLRARLSVSAEHSDADIKKLEQEFVNVVKGFSQRRGISYGAWRDAGISADVLKKAGVPRTRG